MLSIMHARTIWVESAAKIASTTDIGKNGGRGDVLACANSKILRCQQQYLKRFFKYV
jgi:hypothetical protein